MNVFVLDLENYPIFEQLKLEEALLRAHKANFCIINRGTPKSIVMGISGKPDLLIDLKKLQADPIPVIRRFSGGGTVVVGQGTCFVTFILNEEDTGVKSLPHEVFSWSEKFYKPVFADLDFHLLENDYCFGEKKFGGNAQYLSKGRFLLHTSFLWDYDSKDMEYLTLPPKMPSYRNKRSHDDFLTKLKEHGLSLETFHAGIHKRLHQVFSASAVDLEKIKEITALPHRKAAEIVNI